GAVALIRIFSTPNLLCRSGSISYMTWAQTLCVGTNAIWPDVAAAGGGHRGRSLNLVHAGVPLWARLSAEDILCIKRLGDGYSHGLLGDWTKAPPGRSIFVDPEFSAPSDLSYSLQSTANVPS
uniref:Uncharacterized protein n=1 Tax=Aegilops tauschii subsp. strangulata TaxID=200361 RepID=A0A453CZI5_AEGTS